MRIGLVALLVLAGCAHPAPATAPPTTGEGRITLEVKLARAHEVIFDMARMSGANLVYTGNWSRIVCVSFKDVPGARTSSPWPRPAAWRWPGGPPGIVFIRDR
jgi:hypothetical protein